GEEHSINQDRDIVAVKDNLCLADFKIRRMFNDSFCMVQAYIKRPGMLQNLPESKSQLLFVRRAEYVHGRYDAHKCDILKGLVCRPVGFGKKTGDPAAEFYRQVAYAHICPDELEG